MKIATIISEFYPNFLGGLGRFSEYYAKYITKKDNVLYVLTFNMNGKSIPYEDRGPLIVYRPLNKILAKLSERIHHPEVAGIIHFLDQTVNFILFQICSFLTLRKISKRHKIDVISIHDWLTCFPGIFCKIFLKIPIVFHVHSTEASMTTMGQFIDRFKIVYTLEKVTGKLSDQIIVASEQMKHLLVSHGWDERKIKIVYCGIDTKLNIGQLTNGIKGKEEFFEGLFHDIDSRSKILVFAGRLTRHKGIYELLEAFHIIKKTTKAVKLVILGVGEDDKVRDLIDEYGLEGSVHAYYKFFNHQEVLQHFYFADICIFPSFYEPFGLVGLEAMSLGKPTMLGTGYSEMFFGTPSKPNALRVDAESPSDMANKILELAYNEELLKSLSDNGKNFSDKFEQEAMIEATLDHYRDVISRNAIEQ